MEKSSNAIGRALAKAIRKDRGNSIALAATIIWGGLKLMRALSARKREVVYSSNLSPGEGVQIRNLPLGDTGDKAE